MRLKYNGVKRFGEFLAGRILDVTAERATHLLAYFSDRFTRPVDPVDPPKPVAPKEPVAPAIPPKPPVEKPHKPTRLSRGRRK